MEPQAIPPLFVQEVGAFAPEGDLDTEARPREVDLDTESLPHLSDVSTVSSCEHAAGRAGEPKSESKSEPKSAGSERWAETAGPAGPAGPGPRGERPGPRRQLSKLGLAWERRRALPPGFVWTRRIVATYQACSFLRLAAAVVSGGLFGLAFEKSLVYAPAAIRGQFVFETWIMMKMFMGALGASALSFAVFSFICPEQLTMIRGVHAYTENRRRVVFGALLLGAGMAVSGACPGMVIAQVGVRVPQAEVTLLAGILGAFLAGCLRLPYTPPEEQQQRNVEDHVEAKARELLGLSRQKVFAVLALAITVCCWGFALFLELFINYQDEAFEKLGRTNGWPPSLCGAIIGSLQVPCTLLINDSLGTSAAYSAVAGAWRMFKSRKCWVFPQFDAALRKWWQFVYLVSACAAAYGAATEDESAGEVEGVPALHAALGGFVMVFGSRIAEGCTSGHGISGVSLLKVDSILATCAMFGGAVATGVVLKVLGVLLDLEK